MTGAVAIIGENATAGGVEHGDPGILPSFRGSLASADRVVVLQMPPSGGGNATVIRTLLSRTIPMPGDRDAANGGAALRQVLLRVIDTFDATPREYARLFGPTTAIAFLGPKGRDLLLICQFCGTAMLVRAEAGTDAFVSSPQFSIKPFAGLLPQS